MASTRTCTGGAAHSLQAWQVPCAPRTLQPLAQCQALLGPQPPDPSLKLQRPQPPSQELLRQSQTRRPRPRPPPPTLPPQPAAAQEPNPPSTQGGKAASPRQPAPPAGIPTRLLGIDYGPRWTGVALSADGRTRELQVLQVDPNDRGNFARQIVDLALQNEAGGMVVGFPLGLHIDNALTDTRNDTLQARRCRNLANTLALLSLSHNIQVFLYDESGTTKDAQLLSGVRGSDLLMRHDLGKPAKKTDALSAALLLQRFLEKPGAAVRVRVRTSQ